MLENDGDILSFRLPKGIPRDHATVAQIAQAIQTDLQMTALLYVNAHQQPAVVT
jgi:hypothetical protein